jgi:alkylhydroperoxidase family enzyme
VLGQALGLTEAELDALQGDYRASPLFDAREKAVLAWSEAMTLNTAKSDEAVWKALRGEFNEQEIVEISLACAMFNMINRLNDSFRTELESEEYNRRQHGAVGVTREALEEYACVVCGSRNGAQP